MKTKLFLLAAAFSSGIAMLGAQDAPKRPQAPGGEGRPEGPPGGGDPHARFDEAFKKMDANGDGKVSKEEFLNHSKKQAEEGFAKLDKNNDGVIDKPEIAEIEGKMKGLREKMQERGKGKNDGTRKRPGADEKTNGAKPAA